MALADSDAKGGSKAKTGAKDQNRERSGRSGSKISDSVSYFSDSVVELKRVTFPTRAETIQATMATLVIILFVSLCLFVLDLLFGRVMGAVLS